MYRFVFPSTARGVTTLSEREAITQISEPLLGNALPELVCRNSAAPRGTPTCPRAPSRPPRSDLLHLLLLCFQNGSALSGSRLVRVPEEPDTGSGRRRPAWGAAGTPAAEARHAPRPAFFPAETPAPAQSRPGLRRDPLRHHAPTAGRGTHRTPGLGLGRVGRGEEHTRRAARGWGPRRRATLRAPRMRQAPPALSARQGHSVNGSPGANLAVCLQCAFRKKKTKNNKKLASGHFFFKTSGPATGE